MLMVRFGVIIKMWVILFKKSVNSIFVNMSNQGLYFPAYTNK